MKRFCKSVDITSLSFIKEAVLECLRKKCKRVRPDTVRLFARMGSMTRDEAIESLVARDERYYSTVDAISSHMREELVAGSITLQPIHMRDRRDGRSGKVRRLSVQEITQLLYDHVAVMAMSELNRLMGEHQVSGRKGMGQAYGCRLMRKWVCSSRRRLYFVKLDIRKYYGSADIGKVVEWLGRRIKNGKLMWLVDTLLNTGEPGLNIGSYLSHFVANLYLSDIWHKVMQVIPGVRHALFYMDDMILLGGCRRKLASAARAVVGLVEEKGLTVKPGWQVHEVSHRRPVDTMGVRFSRGCSTIRKVLFKHARRAVVRAVRAVRGRVEPTLHMARRLASYHGWFTSTNSFGFSNRYGEYSLYNTIQEKS